MTKILNTPQMTNKELQEKLKQFPDNLIIGIRAGNMDWGPYNYIINVEEETTVIDGKEIKILVI
jgi:hypothetical protein